MLLLLLLLLLLHVAELEKKHYVSVYGPSACLRGQEIKYLTAAMICCTSF